MKPDHTLGFEGIHRFLDGMLGDDMHAKRASSLWPMPHWAWSGPRPWRFIPLEGPSHGWGMFRQRYNSMADLYLGKRVTWIVGLVKVWGP